MLRALVVSFERVFKSCLLLLAAFPGLIDTLLQSCLLEGPCYDCL